MKSSIFKLLGIGLLVALFFSLLTFGVFAKLDKANLYKLPEDKQILIIGSSQSEYGLNDTIIPNSINLSQSGDCSFYNFFKGKKLIEENPQIKTVLLLYTNNMFLAGMDEWIYDEKHIGFKYPKYAHHIDLEHQTLLLGKNPSSFLIAVRDALRSDLQLLIKSRNLPLYQTLDWGGFKTSTSIGDLTAKDEEFDKFYSDTTTASLDILYVEKFYRYCKEEGVQVILVRTPLHHSFPMIKEEALNAYHVNNLDNILFYDYADSVFMDREFKDIQHLNFEGSSRLSKMIKKQLIENNVIKSN